MASLRNNCSEFTHFIWCWSWITHANNKLIKTLFVLWNSMNFREMPKFEEPRVYYSMRERKSEKSVERHWHASKRPSRVYTNFNKKNKLVRWEQNSKILRIIFFITPNLQLNLNNEMIYQNLRVPPEKKKNMQIFCLDNLSKFSSNNLSHFQNRCIFKMNSITYFFH